MGTITLQSRQKLSRRVHTFGSVNGRGYRFGDDRATVQAALNDPANTPHLYQTQLLNTMDWNVLYAADPAWARAAYQSINDASLDPVTTPTIDAWFQQRGITPPSQVVQAPTPIVVSNPASVVVAPVVTPGMTDADYQASVVAAQIEAARLQSMATAQEAANRADSARIAAENALAQQTAAMQDQTVSNTSVTPKSSMGPLLLAAGALYLLLKG